MDYSPSWPHYSLKYVPSHPFYRQEAGWSPCAADHLRVFCYIEGHAIWSRQWGPCSATVHLCSPASAPWRQCKADRLAPGSGQAISRRIARWACGLSPVWTRSGGDQMFLQIPKYGARWCSCSAGISLSAGRKQSYFPTLKLVLVLPSPMPVGGV